MAGVIAPQEGSMYKFPGVCVTCALSTRPQTSGVRCRVSLRWVLAVTGQRSAKMVREQVSISCRWTVSCVGISWAYRDIPEHQPHPCRVLRMHVLG